MEAGEFSYIGLSKSEQYLYRVELLCTWTFLKLVCVCQSRLDAILNADYSDYYSLRNTCNIRSWRDHLYVVTPSSKNNQSNHGVNHKKPISSVHGSPKKETTHIAIVTADTTYKGSEVPKRHELCSSASFHSSFRSFYGNWIVNPHGFYSNSCYRSHLANAISSQFMVNWFRVWGYKVSFPGLQGLHWFCIFIHCGF